MMCAATVNWTLLTDVTSPAQYVMLNSTIGYTFLGGFGSASFVNTFDVYLIVKNSEEFRRFRSSDNCSDTRQFPSRGFLGCEQRHLKELLKMASVLSVKTPISHLDPYRSRTDRSLAHVHRIAGCRPRCVVAKICDVCANTV